MSSKLKFHLLAIVCLLGFSSLSFELIILRQLINFVGSNALITSIIMTVILLFLSTGYYIGSVISTKKNPIRRYMQICFIVMMFLYLIACPFYLMETYFYLFYQAGVRQTLLLVSFFAILFLSIPSVLLGFITSFIGRIIHNFDSNYTGRFMAIDTIGSVLGSLGTTLALMPFIGVSNTITFLIAINIVCLLLITKAQDIKFYLAPIACCLCLSILFNNETFMQGTNNLIKDDAISRIEIIPTDQENEHYLSKLMKINGSLSSKISQKEDLNFEYINFINKTFIKQLDQNYPRDILVLGAGGFTIGIDDTFHRYTFLDIERNLQSISEKHFLPQPLSNNKTFIAQDAYLFLLANKEKYDLIVVDVYSAVQSIPLNFTTTNFFKLVKKHLKKDGIMIANIIASPNFQDKYSRRIDNTLREALGNTLQRTIIQNYNPYAQDLTNIEYIYYNMAEDPAVYTLDKNTSFYDLNYQEKEGLN